MIKKIDGYVNFAKEVSPISFSSKNFRLFAFLNLINGLSSGCGCSLKTRKSFALNSFRQICSILKDSDKVEMKAFFKVETIEITENGLTFCVF